MCGPTPRTIRRELAVDMSTAGQSFEIHRIAWSFMAVSYLGRSDDWGQKELAGWHEHDEMNGVCTLYHGKEHFTMSAIRGVLPEW